MIVSRVLWPAASDPDDGYTATVPMMLAGSLTDHVTEPPVAVSVMVLPSKGVSTTVPVETRSVPGRALVGGGVVGGVVGGAVVGGAVVGGAVLGGAVLGGAVVGPDGGLLGVPVPPPPAPLVGPGPVDTPPPEDPVDPVDPGVLEDPGTPEPVFRGNTATSPGLAPVGPRPPTA